jgi:hypothetical protein
MCFSEWQANAVLRGITVERRRNLLLYLLSRFVVARKEKNVQQLFFLLSQIQTKK